MADMMGLKNPNKRTDDTSQLTSAQHQNKNRIGSSSKPYLEKVNETGLQIRSHKEDYYRLHNDINV
jgi:hypothetical protein